MDPVASNPPPAREVLASVTLRSATPLRDALAEFFQEGNGAMSMTRLVLFISIVIVLGVWAYVSIRAGEMKDVPLGVVTLVGLSYGVKLGQKFGEGSC
jgi:hypothetical protein